MKTPFTANLISFHVSGFFLMILWFHTICKVHFYCLPVFRYRHRLGFLIYLHVGNILGIILSVYLFTIINEEKHPSKEIFLFTEHLCCPLQVCVKICEKTRVCQCWWLRPAGALQPSTVPQGRQATAADGMRVQGSYTGLQQGLIWSEIFKEKLFNGRMENPPWLCSWQHMIFVPSAYLLSFGVLLQCIVSCVLALARGWHGHPLLQKHINWPRSCLS